jgi:ribosome-associated protein
MKYSKKELEKELVFIATRSSGPGGQHVNKVSSKVELRFNIPESRVFNDDEKQQLLHKLKNKINDDGILFLTSQETRSQLKNKEKVLEKFLVLILKSLTPAKKRIPTKPTKSSNSKRLESKKKHSDKKIKRKLISDDV